MIAKTERQLGRQFGQRAIAFLLTGTVLSALVATPAAAQTAAPAAQQAPAPLAAPVEQTIRSIAVVGNQRLEADTVRS